MFNIVDRFTRVHSENNGWIVKLPYTTNGRPWICRSANDVIAAISSYGERVFSGELRDIPYCMIQPRMENNFECKVVCFNMQPLFISERKRGYGKSFVPKNKSGTSSVLAFAGEAIRLLKQRCPAALVDGLVRVDIFRTCAARGSKFVVNEFESLEAQYASKSGVEEADLNDRLVKYWADTIARLVIAKSRRQRQFHAKVNKSQGG